MNEHDKVVQAEIEAAHKQQMQFMNLLKKSSPSPRKTQRGSLLKKGGFIRNAVSGAKDLSTLATSLVMMYRKNSPEAIDGFVDKYGSDWLKTRILVAGKELQKKRVNRGIAGKSRGGSASTDRSVSTDRSESKGKSESDSESKRDSDSKGKSDSTDRSESKGQIKSPSKSKSRSKSKAIEYVQENVYTGEKNEKGEKDGTGKMEYANGDVYEGQWKNNLRNGKGKITFVNKSTYDGTWSKDQITGKGVYTYFNGDVYEGTFDKGVRTGFGKMTYGNGDVYEGHWKKNRREGEGKLHYKNGNKFVGHWKKDLREGEGRLVDDVGKVLEEGEYENDEAPFDVSATYSKVGAVPNQINKVLESVGTNIENVTKSDGAKKVKEAFAEFKKQFVPDLPSYETMGNYVLPLTTIFSAVSFYWSGKPCDPTTAKEYTFCNILQTALNAFGNQLGVAASNFATATAASTTAWNGIMATLSVLVPIGAAGFLFLTLYGTWQYLNAPREDEGRSKKTRRSR